MSFIRFESVQERDIAQKNLREAQEHMLAGASEIAERSAERETKKLLKGEKKLMHNSVKDKPMTKDEEIIKCKKKKRSKKSKKAYKKQMCSTSDENENGDDSATNDDSFTSDNHQTTHKPLIKSKKIPKNKYRTCSDIVAKGADGHNLNLKSGEPLKRDSWMTDTPMIKTYSREHADNNSKEKQQIDAYDPVKSTRELNPYWQTNGTGLPAFQKPMDEDDSKSKRFHNHSSIGNKGWRKQSDKMLKECLPPGKNVSRKTADYEPLPGGEKSEEANHAKCDIIASEFLTDQQMNELGAKLLKAEIMGNMGLADELRLKLEKARMQRNMFKDRQKTSCMSKYSKSNTSKNENILLIHTDQTGQSGPLPPSDVLDSKDVYGGKKKEKQKGFDCHDESCKRVRYFADDDRYDIKQMFEREKYTSASDTNLQFASIAGKLKNCNNDLEDIFTEKISRTCATSDRKDHNRAIREHIKMEAALDKCDKCFDSMKMQKELLICAGENVYLALPWYQGLQPDHCVIIPNQHASSCTQIDENTWAEINEFRKALTRMFAAQHKDVIFFEIANKLRRRSHLVIHCIPIRESDGEMAPFYFRKAIEESEHEWCMNKQLISLRNKSVRSSVPKGLPYFWVHFGMDTGFAHVIENEERFPPNFAQEIIGGMLNLDANKWRQLRKENNVITKVRKFADWWKNYDCTI